MEETRVKKYQAYRRQIREMPSDDTLTTKKMASQRVGKFIKKDKRDTYSTLSFDEVMDTYEIYNNGESTPEKPPFESFYKRRIAYIMIYAIIILSLLVGFIITGVMYFGGH